MNLERKKQLRDMILYLSIGLVSIIAALKFVPNQLILQSQQEPRTFFTDHDAFSVLFFHKNGCPHCELARPVLKKLQDRYPETGWAVFNLSYPTKEMMKAYKSWLKAAGKKQAVTPVIVIGPKSGHPWATTGFMSEEEDRPVIENEIRSRLGKEPIDFSHASLHVPFSGFTILTEMNQTYQTAVIGVLSGFLPLTMFFLAWFSLRRSPNTGSFALSLLALYGVSLGVHYFWVPISLPVRLDGALRLFGGGVVLFVAFSGFFRFFKGTQWLFNDSNSCGIQFLIPFFSAILALDFILTRWLNDMRETLNIPFSFGFCFFFFIPFLFLFLFHLLAKAMKERTYPRLKLLFFIFLLVNLYWGLLLFTGHGFSGYGSWHWFGA